MCRGLEDQQKKLSGCMSAMRKQEKVIKELQGALSKESSWRKNVRKLTDDVGNLQHSNGMLRNENSELKLLKGVDEIEALKLELEAARGNEAKAQTSYNDMESEKLEAMMRMEKAEAAAVAAQNELLEVPDLHQMPHISSRLSKTKLA